MIEELLVSATPFGMRTATIAGGEVLALNAESETSPGLLGNIYVAAPGRRGGTARFVAIGEDQNAFLQKLGANDDNDDNPIVQVTRAAWRGKAPRVSGEVALAGRHIVYFPKGDGAKVAQRIGDESERQRLLTLAGDIARDGGGVTIRSMAQGAGDGPIRAEAQRHRRQWAEITAKRTELAAPALLASGPGLAERLMRDILPPDARILTDDRAMLARLTGYAEQWAPEFLARLEFAGGALFERHDAAGAAAREIRRRNLAGLIVIDFPRLDGADAGEALMAEMRAHMQDDPVAHRVTGISASGLMEITRRRAETPILDALTEPTDGGYGGRRRRLDALAFDIAQAARLQVQAGARAVTLSVAPALAAFLGHVNGGAGVKEYAALGDWLGGGVTVRDEPARRREDWAIDVE